MNPIDSYRDAALDGLLDPRNGPLASHAAPPPRKPPHHSRQTSMATADTLPPSRLPLAPEPPRGQPIIYPGNESAGRGAGVQRSFSQRARGRPYADEAFADDDLGEARRNGADPAPRSSTGRAPVGQESAPPLHDPREVASTVRRQQIIQDNIRSAADAAYSQRRPAERTPASGMAYEAVDSRAPGVAKAPPGKDARDWAPDRSPLQKLEVTLNDISKEEKRARMQEAEMLHREKTRSQRPTERGAPAAAPPSSRAQAATIEELGVVRGLSTTHRDRLQHSTVVDARKPDPARLTTETPGFEYHTAAVPTSSVIITRRSQRNPTQPTAPAQRAVSHTQPAAEPTRAPAHARSVSATHSTVPAPRIAPSHATPGGQRPKPKARLIPDADRLPTAQERNASHRAALQHLEGTAPLSNPKRGRRDDAEGDDAVPPEPPSGSVSRDTRAQEPHDARPDRSIPTQPPNGRTWTPQGQSMPARLDMQASPGPESVDSAAPVDKLNPAQRQKRQSSVSFKDPYERRRPTDEWKSAETARLTAEDFILEPRTDVDHERAWWEQDAKSRRRSSRAQATAAAADTLAVDDRVAEFRPRLLLKCGPLLRYTGMKRTLGEGAKEYWRGTVLIVTRDAQSSYEKPPTLRLFAQPKSLYQHPPPLEPQAANEPHSEHFDPVAGSIKMSRVGRALYVRPVHNLPPGKDLSQVETDDGLFESSPPITSSDGQVVSVAPVSSRLSPQNGESCGRYQEIKGVRLYADPDRDVTFWLFKLEVQLGREQQHVGYRINGGAASGFWVPAEGQTMHIMFHSCNGFSLSVKSDDFSGPDPLWRDVLNAHQSRPFHVMLGGGDQIYNDKIMNQTQLFRAWTANKNPHYKHHAPFTTEMKEELESFYLDNYCAWFSQGLFAMAAAQIPMVNMWDDHDIIDGFGSYPHAFQLSPVFSGVGNVAFKYYMLFQQHSVDAMTTADEPSWILGYKPGPYIKQLSRSIFLELGRSVALLALDCRTERMKNQVLSLDTCDIALERCRKEIIEGETKHLIVLLGIPIAYPRMNWLENVLTSRAMDPVKALGRYGVIKGGFLNRFDGGVEVLDDLDDHWTANHHKEERNELIKELQDLAAERSVRITILGGDVHLGAIGQFYSNPKLKIPKDRDHRYMANVISSAIVNTPPPDLLADVLNKRNKVHHLDRYTDESMVPMFTHDVDGTKRNNKHLLPRRNWCSITEYTPGKTPPSSRSTSPARSDSLMHEPNRPARRPSLSKDDFNPRTLIRRLSSKKAPPSAYDNPYHAARGLDPRVDGNDAGPRAASLDDVRPDRSQPRSWNARLGLTRRTASETREPALDAGRASNDEWDSRKPPPFRPGFHRRPTNLSEKAAKKGNVPAIDADGNEIDVNDHISLEHAIDIVLNFEINRQDPRGATDPQRLVIPALWYDGSSDREKLDGADGLHRKPTLMNRLGIGSKKSHSAAQSQGAGNWGKDVSETDSSTGGDDEDDGRPKKKFGLFGSFRKKRLDHEEGHRDESDHHGAAGAVAAADLHPHDQPGTAFLASDRDQVAYHGSSTTPKDTPPRMSHQAGPTDFDMPYDMSSVQHPPAKAAFNQPPARPAGTSVDVTDNHSTKGNVLRKNSVKRQAMMEPARDLSRVAPTTATTTTYHHEMPTTTVRTTVKTTYPEPPSPTAARRNSYTIGSQRSSSSHQNESGLPFDTDSTYIASNQQRGSRVASNPVASNPTFPPPSFPTRAPDVTGIADGAPLRSSASGAVPGRSANKHEQILGLGTDRDAVSGPPQQRMLRGNGILGRFGFGSGRSVSADRVDQRHSEAPGPGPMRQPAAHAGRAEFGAPQRTLSQGYSGIEAYTDKPKRGLSLRDRARNLRDRVEGRKRFDDDEDSYGSQGSFSDELGEEPGDHGHPHGHHHHDEHYDDGEGFSVEGDDAVDPPKRGLSQKFRLGMRNLGSRRAPARAHEDYDPGEDNSEEGVLKSMGVKAASDEASSGDVI